MYGDLDHTDEFYKLTLYEQATLLEWCERLEKLKTIHKSESSYTIKHYFEYSAKGFYVTNGAMKEALVLSGFEILDRRQQNYQVNVSKRSINKMFKEMCMVH